MVHLHFTNEGLEGHTYELVHEKTTVGRASENLLCIRHASLSRMHCEILVYGAEVIVRDLGSRNGTWVSGRRLVNQQCQIRAGDIIRFGPVEARLEMDIPREEPDSEESGYFDLSKLEAATAARREKEQHAKVHWPLQNAVTERTLELLHPPAKSDTELTPAPAAPAPTQLHRSRIILAAALIIAAAFFLFRFLLRRFPFG